MERKILPLSIGESKLYVNTDLLLPKKEELESFLEGNKYMNSKKFAKNVLFSHEIKNNNNVEGYYDDIDLVYNILNNNLKINDKNKEQRIKNLYSGYKYIYKERPINKDNLKELYSILSKGLLTKKELNEMGEYYRLNPVYIFYSSNLATEPEMGMNADTIDFYMNELFDYINDNSDINYQVDHFIKSQIMHFQFVNIHPYYDINGRTARTTSMWYLLNNEVYPYIIFNRAILMDKPNYYKIIRDVKKYHNVTYFTNYMLENVRVELEKEYVIDMIKSVASDITALDYQTIYYILSMNSELTVKDFINFYNTHNDKKKGFEIYNNMIIPLLEKGIIEKGQDTKSFLNSSEHNFRFRLNDNMYECDDKVKYLKLKK